MRNLSIKKKKKKTLWVPVICFGFGIMHIGNLRWFNICSITLPVHHFDV